MKNTTVGVKYDNANDNYTLASIGGASYCGKHLLTLIDPDVVTVSDAEEQLTFSLGLLCASLCN
jgi:hypothetical protein